MRFSLRDLMLFVAFWAGVAWCAAQIGFDSGAFWFLICILAAFSTAFVSYARDERRRWRPLRVTLPVLVLSFLIGSLSLLVNSVLLTISTLVFARRAVPSVRVLCAVSMTSALVALLAAVLPVRAYMRELETARNEMPTISLVNRLQFHGGRHESPADPIIKAAVVTRLEEFEQSLDRGSERKHQLARLHSYQYVLFVQTMGFGVFRMIPLTPQSLRRPPLRDIRWGELVKTDFGGERGTWRAFGMPYESKGLECLHMASRYDFLDPDGFGVAIETPLKVTGFVEHAFHYPPTSDLGDSSQWTILRLELVSLLKFAEPRIYVLDHLPRMDQLSSDNAPTRPLDAFESEALAKLWRDEDIVVKNEGSAYRMLGSLRAAKQCLDCHGVQRGELLGAFSYSLRHEAGPAGPKGNSRDR